MTALTPLARETDALNEAFARCEAALARLDLGVTAEVPLPDAGGYLGFGKLDQQWRLYYQPLCPDGREVPLVSASRAVRVEAAAHLTPLLLALDVEVRAAMREVSGAIARVNDFTCSLPPGP